MSARRVRSGRKTPPRGTSRAAWRDGTHEKTPSFSAPRRATTFLIGALLCVTPLLVVPGAKEPFRLVQGLASAWLGLASLAAASLLLRRATPPISVAALWRHPAVRAVLPLAAVVAAGGLVTSHPTHFRASFADFAIGAACLVGWSLALGEPVLRRLLRWTIPAAVIVAALGLDQFLGWFGLLDWLGVIAPTARLRLTSTAGNPGDLASLLVLPTIVALSLFREAGRRARLALGGAVAIMLLTIAVTATFAAIAAVAAGGVVWWLLSRPAADRARADAGGDTTRGRPVPATVVVIVIGALGAGVFAVWSPLRARVVEEAAQFRRGDVNAVLTGRLDGWRAAWRMLRESPFAGVGQGAFRAEYADTRLALMAEGVPFLPQTQAMFSTPHDEALSVAAEQGLPGLLALAWAVWCLGSAALTPAPLNRKPLAIAGLVALGILSTLWFPLHAPAVAWPWLLFLAWLCSRSEPDAQAKTAQVRYFFPIVVVALLLALAWQTSRMRDRLIASVLLARAETRTLAAIEMGRAPSTIFAENLAWLDEARRRDPLEIGVPIARGTQFLLLHQPDAALAAYREAAALEPRPEIDLNIGRALWMKGQQNDARAAFARAVRLDGSLRSDVPPGALE